MSQYYDWQFKYYNYDPINALIMKIFISKAFWCIDVTRSIPAERLLQSLGALAANAQMYAGAWRDLNVLIKRFQRMMKVVRKKQDWTLTLKPKS